VLPTEQVGGLEAAELQVGRRVADLDPHVVGGDRAVLLGQERGAAGDEDVRAGLAGGVQLDAAALLDAALDLGGAAVTVVELAVVQPGVVEFDVGIEGGEGRRGQGGQRSHGRQAQGKVLHEGVSPL
jgi:hypothetical protein